MRCHGMEGLGSGYRLSYASYHGMEGLGRYTSRGAPSLVLGRLMVDGTRLRLSVVPGRDLRLGKEFSFENRANQYTGM